MTDIEAYRILVGVYLAACLVGVIHRYLNREFQDSFIDDVLEGVGLALTLMTLGHLLVLAIVFVFGGLPAKP